MLQKQLEGYAWAFSAAIGNGVQDNLRKYISNSIPNALHAIALMEFLNCLTLFVYLLMTGNVNVMRGCDETVIVLASVSAIIKCVGSVAFQRALQLTPISLCAPYMAFTPLWLLGLSFFIVHEIPSGRGVVGVLVMTLGAYGLNSAASKSNNNNNDNDTDVGGDNYNKREGKEAAPHQMMGILTTTTSTTITATTTSSPSTKREGVLRRVRRSIKGSLKNQVLALRKQPGCLISFCVAGLWGLTSDIDKLGKNASVLHAGGIIVYIALQRIFMAAPLGMLTAASNPEAFSHLQNPKTFLILFGMGICELYTIFAYLKSLEHLFTSYAVAAKRSGILLSVLGGAIMFKEPIGDRLPYVLVIIIGMIFIIFSDEY